ncbi:MAG TPA: UvrD-helicase domain-containing protein, partial [Candidatus Methylacidiphilales bacterium]|nr:UvrD-helicase domain-containing protein [Candidatus Methylacidiphilales bacterium]
MSGLVDQAERDRFAQEHGKNISVTAPAGVGKTTSIVRRIVQLARLPEETAADRLSRIVVVTYSVRAAQQMQQKARIAIRAAAVPPRVQRAFQQTFFGTIHSYCVRLLDRFGHYLGLPSPVGLLQDEDELWERFLVRGLDHTWADDPHLRRLFQFYPPNKLYALGRQISPGDELPFGPPPQLDWQKFFDYNDTSLHAQTKKSIANAQQAARHWSEAWARGEGFRSLPAGTISKNATAFAAIWAETFAPLHDWLRESALAFGRRLANAYERFRLAEAVMTYDDQVRLALRVLDHPAARRELAEERLSVLLDEAQDTDWRQFAVLQRVAGLGENSAQAGDQNLSIVGDFQQAIYVPRSDLAVYRRIHDEITTSPRGALSRLKVTFRCDRAIIDFANKIFPTLLNDTGGQSAFEPLVARDDAGPGQVVRWGCGDEPVPPPGRKINLDMRVRHEAQFLARRLAELGPAAFGAAAWSQVAILCPRNDWLLKIQRELAAAGLPVQLHVAGEERRDHTPTAWLTALTWIAAHPEDSFEIAGVLRDILGVSDSDMAIYTCGKGDKLRLDRPAPASDDPVETALKYLHSAWAGAEAMPLHQAVRRAVEKTHLRERLDAIADETGEPGCELDDLLAMVAARSAKGVTLADLAQELQVALVQGRPAEEEIRNEIQLLTSYKAKGLEWDAVIVPFLFRPIGMRSPSYPKVVLGEAGRETVYRDKADYERGAKAFETTREAQQLQRLLYVAATRAKRTLVLIDDEALFTNQERKTGPSSGELLGLT